jgi:hypothetical protein
MYDSVYVLTNALDERSLAAILASIRLLLLPRRVPLSRHFEPLLHSLVFEVIRFGYSELEAEGGELGMDDQRSLHGWAISLYPTIDKIAVSKHFHSTNSKSNPINIAYQCSLD